jgi:hypothetical protein
LPLRREDSVVLCDSRCTPKVRLLSVLCPEYKEDDRVGGILTKGKVNELQKVNSGPENDDRVCMR